MDGVYRLDPQSGDRQPYGYLCDGAVYKLDGQPPLAVSHSWWITH
jgi:hypothetical protein